MNAAFIHKEAGLEPGAQGYAGFAVGAVRRDLDAQDLVQLDPAGDEPEPGCGHVQPPDSRLPRADLTDGLVPVRLEIGAPVPQREGVVLAEVLLVTDLETVVLHRGRDRPHALQLTVREDVP